MIYICQLSHINYLNTSNFVLLYKEDKKHEVIYEYRNKRKAKYKRNTKRT